MTQKPINPLDAPMHGRVVGPSETLVNGRTFVVARPTGEISFASDGAVFEDVRFLSLFRIGLAGPAGPLGLQFLRTARPNPFTLIAVSKVLDGATTRSVTGKAVLIHQCRIGRGTHHRIEVRNLGHDAAEYDLTVGVGADFAHLFDMKSGKPIGESGELERLDKAFELAGDGRNTRITTAPMPARADRHSLTWTVELGPLSSGFVEVATEPILDGEPAGALFGLGTGAVQAQRSTADPEATLITNNPAASNAFRQALEDLASLRIYDPEDPSSVVVAAGAPWFMTLFGRDSLLTSWMALPFAPELAVGVLRALARLQGETSNPTNEEQPGKIIHELRRSNGSDSFADRGRYYGTVDATPLFVMLAHETWRWGHLDDGELASLWPAIVRATRWITRSIEASPQHLLTYQRSTDTGLVNQGWKDSWDGVTGADGKPATGPIALVEVQGYAHAAMLAAARLTDHLARRGVEAVVAGHEDGLDVEALRRGADRLHDRFNSQYWVEDLECFALALDGDGNPVRSVTTNPGHAVWSGIADASLADRYLTRCLEPDLFSGWGLRTLSTNAAAYNPLSYHNGSVWPHDTSIVAAAAARQGRSDIVTRLADAAFDTAAAFDNRPPELHAGFARDDIPAPVPYPSSCSPQAWSSAAMLLYVRSLLGLEPSEGAPLVGRDWDDLQYLGGIRVGSGHFSISSDPQSDELPSSPV